MTRSLRRPAVLLLIGVALVCVLVLASPHHALHGSGDVDCSLCLVSVSEAPEPPRILRPLAWVAHAGELTAQLAHVEWEWTAFAPRAPPTAA